MNILGNRVLFWVGAVWLVSTLIIAAAFLLGNLESFEDSDITGIVFLNIFGFGLWSIPGFVLIFLGRRRSLPQR